MAAAISHKPSSLLSGWKGDSLALVAGALMPLAFAPFHLFPLAVLSPALLFAVWLDVSALRALWRGWLFGAGMFGVGVSWVYVAIHVFGQSSVLVATLLTGGFAAFLALFPALVGYITRRFFPSRGGNETLTLLLVLPAAWTLIEWVRGWILTGFPWLNLGYSQLDSPLVGIAPVFGVYGVSLACAFSAGLLVLLLRARIVDKMIAVGGFILLWGGTALLGNVQWTRPAGEPLDVSLIQGNIPQDVKWQPEQQQSTLALYADLTRRNWKSDLILWPEAALPLFYHQLADSYLAALDQQARAHDTDLLIGLPVFDPQTRRYYNSMMSLGSGQGFYHKQHLVPFGDYVPLQGLLRGLISFFDLPMSGFSPGPKGQPLLAAAGYQVGISICYEDAFGEEVIDTLPEAKLLVNATNNAWYGDSLAPHQHLQISRMRALETGRFMLRATTNGISAIINSKGEIIARSPQFETYVLTGKAEPRQGATPYVGFGNLPVLLMVVLMLGAGLALTRKAARKHPPKPFP